MVHGFDFDIEVDVELPPRNWSRERKNGRKAKVYYPFPVMDVGDSFVVPREKEHAARLAASDWQRRHAFRFVSRRTEDGGRRIWRVE